MYGRSTASCYGRTSHVHCARGLYSITIFAVLAVCCRAQTFGIDVVEISIGNNNRSTAIVPDEVDSIRIVTESTISDIQVEPSEFFSEGEPSMKSCEGNNCTLNIMGVYPSASCVVITILHDIFNQTLTLTIRENLNASCAQYNVPKSITGSSNNSYSFTCEPAMVANNTNYIVTWRAFRVMSDLMMFLEGDTSFEGNIITENDTFSLGGDGNNTLNILSSVREDVAFYYVPSFTLAGSNTEQVTAETLLYVSPVITTPVPEFSIEIIFNSKAARRFDGIRCEADTFPAAGVSWLLTNEENPIGVNVSTLTQFNLTNSSGKEEDLRRVSNAIVVMSNLQYEDDGTFTCTVDNGQATASQSFRLRVKSNLRPLWPALGIIGVFLLVGVIMLTCFTVEQVVEKKKKSHGYQNADSSPNHTDQGQRLSSVSSAGQANSRGRKHDAVKRLSSNKPLIDESNL